MKNNQNQNTSKITEKIKWLFVFIFFILSFFMNYYFYNIQIFIRLCIIFFSIISSIIILFYTKKGKNILLHLNMSKKEMKKITWPQYKDTLYTTFIVITVTIFISLILWCLDSIIFRLIAFIINLRL